VHPAGVAGPDALAQRQPPGVDLPPLAAADRAGLDGRARAGGPGRQGLADGDVGDVQRAARLEGNAGQWAGGGGRGAIAAAAAGAPAGGVGGLGGEGGGGEVVVEEDALEGAAGLDEQDGVAERLLRERVPQEGGQLAGSGGAVA
jgi:hypothetical protein